VINLAGVKDCDDTILAELCLAGVPVVWSAEPINREVAFRASGRMGLFLFERAWRYWVVRGPMPLSAAHELYKNPLGRATVRVAGHCGCPPPEKPWIEFIDADGIELIARAQLEDEEKRFGSPSPLMIESRKCGLNELRYRIVENPAAEGLAIIPSYHIDSQEGLNLFVATIRKYKLALHTRCSCGRSPGEPSSEHCSHCSAPVPSEATHV
jgi:hypothetical protein